MAIMPKDWYRQEAIRLLGLDEEERAVIEIDAHAEVSTGPTMIGAWVQAWVWVPDPGQAPVTTPTPSAPG